MTFQDSFKYGRIAENKIAVWLLARGNSLMPVYEVETEDGAKGPRIFSLEGELIAPDLLTFTRKKVFWVEAKRKTHFTWHRKTGTWQTGIDIHCYKHYLNLANSSPFPLWLLFLHEDSLPDPRDLRMGSPPECPTGLYGDDILRLADCVDHQDYRWARHGMIYWREVNLRLIASVEDVNLTVAGRKPVVRVENILLNELDQNG